MFEQYLSLIRIFAVFYFPQVFATFIYLRTCEREKLWNSYLLSKKLIDTIQALSLKCS